MQRLTLGAARATIARVLGTCESDARIPVYLNAAIERLLPRGKWKGTFVRYRTCVSSGCVTLSRHMETVEGFSLCRVPGMIRNEFFEFQGTSYGILGENDCPGNTLINRGLACAFDDFSSLTQKAKVYSDCAEAPGAYILLLGYDENRNWIRSLVAGVWEDGERVPLSTTFQISSHYFSSLVAVQKPVTNGNVRVYSYDSPSGANVKAIAVYEPDETLPQYRRYLIPGLSMSGTESNDCQNDCDMHGVDMLVKLAFVPASRDTDYLVIQNLQALRLAVMGLKHEENNQWDMAEICWEGRLINEYGVPARRGGAIPLLESELANFNGDGPVATPRMEDPALWGAGYIENFN